MYTWLYSLVFTKRSDSPLLKKFTVFQKLSQLCCYYSVSFVTKKDKGGKNERKLVKLLDSYRHRYVAVNKVLLHFFNATAISELTLFLHRKPF